MNIDKYTDKIDELADDGLLRIILNKAIVVKKEGVIDNE